MLRNILIACGPFGIGFSLWTTTKKYPDFFGTYAHVWQFVGSILMLFAGLVVVIELVKVFLSWIKGKGAQIIELKTENKGLRERLDWKDTEKAGNAVRRCKDLWEGRDRRNISTNTYEDDPVYLQVLLDSAIAKIVAQPIVQRLNHIKQLSFAYLTFRSANLVYDATVGKAKPQRIRQTPAHVRQRLSNNLVRKLLGGCSPT